jgi:hypothetical protein
MEQVERASDGTGGETTRWRKWREQVMERCNAETEKNVCSFVINQPAVYFTTITDFYQFRRINKCYNIAMPHLHLFTGSTFSAAGSVGSNV